jgi:hypothetical protein
MNSTARAPFVYPPPSPLATPRSPRTLVALDFARAFDDDPPGVEIDAQRDGFGERQKQSFARMIGLDHDAAARKSLVKISSFALTSLHYARQVGECGLKG